MMVVYGKDFGNSPSVIFIISVWENKELKTAKQG